MDCQVARDKMGIYLDGELPAELAATLENHLQQCSDCAQERRQLQALVDRLKAEGAKDAVSPPTVLWSAIEQRLTEPSEPVAIGRFVTRLRRPLAAAASVAILAGAALMLGWLLNSTANQAHADMVDYSVLLDGLGADVDHAVARFLEHYGAQAIEPSQAPSAAPDLSFAIPPELPGGFRQERVYRLRFGIGDGVAAVYRRGDEPLVVFFHPPVSKEHVGIHTQSSCMVSGRDGYRIEVGQWQLVHFTDATTCHCVLSTLDLQTELPAVLAAVAPEFAERDSLGH